jgi:hypothetical protein
MPQTYRKTDHGRQALSTRQPALSRPMRNLLLLIDGQRSDEALLSMLSSPDLTPGSFEQLRELGLIEAISAGAAASPPGIPPGTPPGNAAAAAPAAQAPSAAPAAAEPPTAADAGAAPQGRRPSAFARLGQGVRAMLQAQQESPREVSAGLAEIIKCAAVGDAEFFAWLESQLDALRARESAAVAHAVQRFPELRAQIEAQDRQLQRAPSPLSFGSRLGGVIESLVGYGQYLHGETVGLGMWMATALGEDLGVQSPSSAARLRDVLVRAGLPTRLPRVAAARWLDLLPVDRTGPQGMLELVLLEDVARPQVRRVPPSAVLEALDKAGALSSG